MLSNISRYSIRNASASLMRRRRVVQSNGRSSVSSLTSSSAHLVSAPHKQSPSLSQSRLHLKSTRTIPLYFQHNYTSNASVIPKSSTTQLFRYRHHWKQHQHHIHVMSFMINNSNKGSLSNRMMMSTSTRIVQNATPQQTTEQQKSSDPSASIESNVQTNKQIRREKMQKHAGKLRVLWQQYGYTAIGVYMGVYVGTLGTLYLMVSTNLVGAGDAISLLKAVGIDRFLDVSELGPKKSGLALAWILTKVVEPLRLALSVAITPSIARLIGHAPKNSSSEKAVSTQQATNVDSKQDK
jgi:FAM210A/B-like domain